MKIKALLAAALAAAALDAFAAVSKEHADWGNGPAQYLMTKEEAAQWKSVANDADARAFIDLFWAKRDPSPGTPRNETREEFEARVEYADKNLAERRKRGSMTDRGKTLILYGQPVRIERSAQQPNTGFTGGSPTDQPDQERWIQWIYEGDEAKTMFGAQRVALRFNDRMGNGDYKSERSGVDLNAAQNRVVERMLVNRDLKTVPTYTAPAPSAAAAPVVIQTSTAPMTALRTIALADAVTAFKAKPSSEASVIFGEYVTPAGDYFVPVMLSVPQNAGLAANQDVTFFGVFEDESGKTILAFEEPRKLHESKADLFVDKSVALPAGKIRGYVGISAGGKTLIAPADMTLAGTLDKDAPAISQLILSNFVQPMAEAQKPDDPYAFGGIKVVPKADRTFRTSDELWFFFELRNPGLAPDTNAPKVQIKMDVEGKDAEGKTSKKAAPLREIEAAEMKGVPGHYGVGNAIPLESFKPGDYTFTLKVIDTVRKQSYTLTEKFKVIP